MAKLLKMAEHRKTLLIEKLLTLGVFKTTDERHLYDAPLSVLEEEYEKVKKGTDRSTTG